jgi:hypothetical protein
MVTKTQKTSVKIRTQDMIDLLINSNYDVDSPFNEEKMKGLYVSVDTSKWTLHADGKGVTIEWEA